MNKADQLNRRYYALIDRYIEITKKIVCIDRDVLVQLRGSEIELLGISMAETAKVLEDILEDPKNEDLKLLLKEKMKHQAELQHWYSSYKAKRQIPAESPIKNPNDMERKYR